MILRGASVLLNAVLLAGVAVKVRRLGLRGTAVRVGVMLPAPNDYAALGRERFGHVSPGRVGLFGDSQAQNAPLLDMVTDWRQYGIGGATIREALSWLPTVRCDRLVVFAGTNDVLIGRPVAESVTDAAALLDAAGRPVTWLAVPPLVGHDVAPLNAALRDLCAAWGAGWVDTAAVVGLDWTDDGVHLNRAAYLRLGAKLAQVAG